MARCVLFASVSAKCLPPHEVSTERNAARVGFNATFDRSVDPGSSMRAGDEVSADETSPGIVIEPPLSVPAIERHGKIVVCRYGTPKP
jgi:hypothetical protein